MAETFVVYSREQVERLFDAQLETLRLRGFSESLIRRFRSRRQEVINEAISTVYPEGHLPFAPRVGPSGQAEYVHDLPPAPAGMLPASVRSVALAEPVPASLDIRPAADLTPVGTTSVLRQRLALEAYGRCGRGEPPTPTISVYA